MFGRRERDKQELIQFLVAVRNEICALREEICALREEIAGDRQGDTEKRDPDVLSEGELMSKWAMGEHGDGI